MAFKYFKLKEAFSEARDSFSFGDKSDKISSTAKLLGKTVANVGMFAVEAGIEVVKRAPEYAADASRKHLESQGNNVSSENREKLKTIIEKGDESKSRRLEEERTAEMERLGRKKEEEERKDR